MLPNVQGASFLNTLINQYWLLYKSDIMALSLKWFKEEDIKEKSLLQYKVMQYHYALYYVILIQIEVSRGIHSDWAWYEDKFKILQTKRCLACHGIDLDDVLEIFNFPLTGSYGIEHIGIESSFIVEPTSLTPSTPTLIFVDIPNLLANPTGCTNNIVEVCNP